MWTLITTLEATRWASETHPGRRALANRNVPTPPVSQAGTRGNASTAPHTNHLPHTVLENLFLNDPEVVCAEALPWEFAPV